MSPTLQLNLEDLTAFLESAFPEAARLANCRLTIVELNHIRMQLDPGPNMLRPGNIVSGPTLMSLADVAAYAAVLAHIGPVPMAVTTTLNISFLRPALPATLTADARLLKLGRRLATIDIGIWQETETNLIAHATVGYALP